jgi:hypothetical protein
MILRLIHAFIGHNWSEWRLKHYSVGSYDEETWYERVCECGAKEREEFEEVVKLELSTEEDDDYQN